MDEQMDRPLSRGDEKRDNNGQQRKLDVGRRAEREMKRCSRALTGCTIRPCVAV